MRARIATIAGLMTIALLVTGPALAEECSLADTVLEQCPPQNPSPEPQPQPQPAPEPQPGTQPEPGPQAQQSVPPGHQPAAVARLLTLLNGERAQRGLPAFALREAVSAQSRKHSEAMAATGTIWHNDAYFAAANKARLGAVLLGENVARNVDIDDAHRRLMNSPGHKANIVDRRFTVIGLGVYRSGTGSLYVTQSFVQPVAAKAAAAAPAAKAGERPRDDAAAAPTPPETVPAPATASIPDLPLFGDGSGPQVLAAPAGLGTPGGTGSPATPLALALALALAFLAASASMVVLRHRRLFAPLVSRFRR